MKIAGINKTTLLDYPGHVAATIFTAGCNFRCPFCHNKSLVSGAEELKLLAEEEVLEFLKKRRNVLAGICVTGGEPSRQPELADFLGKVKELGYLIKLDTNGYRPEVVKELLENGLLDYIAMDIKNCREQYQYTAGCEKLDLDRIEKSIDIIRGCGRPYEFRTTVVKELHGEAELRAIGAWLAGSKNYFLQAYEENENVIQPGFHGYEKQEMCEFAQMLSKEYGLCCQVRGIS